MELNFELSTFWDAGYTIKLGDTANGFINKSPMLDDLNEVASELVRMTIEHLPNSEFAKKYKITINK